MVEGNAFAAGVVDPGDWVEKRDDARHCWRPHNPRRRRENKPSFFGFRHRKNTAEPASLGPCPAASNLK